MAVANRLIFCLILLLAACQAKPSKEGFKIATAGDPQTLDPRLARELFSVNQAHLLYQGLFRKDCQGATLPALAESYEIRNEGKSYRFFLRDCRWSDGSPLLAHDVVRSWRSVQENPFAPFAYQFSEIESYEAESDKVLRVDLIHPNAHFIELLATNSFFPVHESPSLFSGPFVLEEWIPHRHLILKKNPNYWDAANISLDRVVFEKIHDSVALQLFEHGALDWVGSPLGNIPLHAMEHLKQQPTSTPALATRFLRLNVERVHLPARKALESALDREKLVHLISKSHERAAYSFLPSLFALDAGRTSLKSQISGSFSVIYIQNEVNHLIAQYLEQEWKTLGIRLHLKPCNPQVFYEALSLRDYDVAIGTWYACTWDPLNFLEFLKDENETNWRSDTFASLLDQVAGEPDEEKRGTLLEAAQQVLQEEVPIIPLYYPSFLHLTNHDSIRVNPLGFLDFHQ